jgi:hydroxypyruvate reductase
VNASKPQDILIQLYRAALDAADPLKVIPPHLPPRPKGRTVVVGVGKAAAEMALTIENIWEGPLSGIVVVPEGALRPLNKIKTLIGSHPIPDANSVKGAEALLESVSGLTSDDLVIALISGGGSALCAKPAPGLSLAEKQGITRELLMLGASISEINTVRRHLSAIKGGRLAAQAFPAKLVTLLISDIPGDDPSLIASGPTLADRTTCADALAILRRYKISVSSVVQQALLEGSWESVKPNDKRLQGNKYVIVASAWNGLQAANMHASSLGLDSHILSDAMEGEARDLAKAHTAIALSVAQRNVPFKTPCVLISGGEATVTVRGKGRGGRNTEFILAAALALKGQMGAERISAISAGTDGLDGSAKAAGAWMDSQTINRGVLHGLSGMQSLDNNDSASFLDAASCLIHTGPTYTNINDFRAFLIL